MTILECGSEHPPTQVQEHMDDRCRALEILREARDLLAQRLTERVLESGEALLDDARGDSYLGDIESIYDQFGLKLAHLNQLINNLPVEMAAPPPGPISDPPPVPPEEAAPVQEIILTKPPAITGPLIIAPPALPGPMLVEDAVATPTLPLFAAQIRDDNLRDAARTLSVLLDISEARGMQCVRIFHRRWNEDETFVLKALQLRGEVIAGSYNAALMILAECFGLVGIEAIGVLQALRNRLSDRHD